MENTIHVGAYTIPEDGVISIPKSKFKILSRYVGINDDLKLFDDDRITLCLEDGNFWAFISKMSIDEAKKLCEALYGVIIYKEKGGKGQLTITIEEGGLVRYREIS
ncbi:MAG: hypothetical protein H3Z53_02145 [archaeon]|nr:hypothetical protein [archaeon]